MSEHQPQSVEDMTQHIVTSDGAKKARRHKRTHFRGMSAKWALVVVLMLLAVGVGGWYVLSNRQDKILPPRIVDISGVSEYDEMSKYQIDYFLYTKTGLTIEYLQKKGVHSKQLNTYDKAYQVARALTAYGDKKAGLQAYAIAQGKRPASDDYQFYFDYAVAAIKNDDKATWKKEMLLARAVVAKQPQSKQPTEDMTTDQIDQMIAAVESGNE